MSQAGSLSRHHARVLSAFRAMLFRFCAQGMVDASEKLMILAYMEALGECRFC